MDSYDLTHCLKVAQQEARKLAYPPHAVDALAQSTDDYANDLALKAYMQAAQTRLSGEGGRKYICQAIRNRAIDWARARTQRRKMAPWTPWDDEAMRVAHSASGPYERAEAVQMLDYLKRRLPPGDWDLLQRVAHAKSVRAAYDVTVDKSARDFFSRVKAAREAARALSERGHDGKKSGNLGQEYRHVEHARGF